VSRDPSFLQSCQTKPNNEQLAKKHIGKVIINVE
jgi:hypothetical protein